MDWVIKPQGENQGRMLREVEGGREPGEGGQGDSQAQATEAIPFFFLSVPGMAAAVHMVTFTLARAA